MSDHTVFDIQLNPWWQIQISMDWFIILLLVLAVVCAIVIIRRSAGRAKRTVVLDNVGFDIGPLSCKIHCSSEAQKMAYQI